MRVRRCQLELTDLSLPGRLLAQGRCSPPLRCIRFVVLTVLKLDPPRPSLWLHDTPMRLYEQLVQLLVCPELLPDVGVLDLLSCSGCTHRLLRSNPRCLGLVLGVGSVGGDLLAVEVLYGVTLAVHEGDIVHRGGSDAVVRVGLAREDPRYRGYASTEAVLGELAAR